MSVKMGWLKTREEENYAPKTVIEGVYEASSGKLYDKVIKDYINNKFSDVNPSVATLQTTVAAHTTEIDNLKLVDNAINSSIDAIKKSIENIQDDGSDTLYIIDSEGYKIAQVDKYGIHSIEVYNKNTSLGAVADRMTAAETQLSTIASGDLSSDDDTFYIIDQYDNIIAKIDKNGITSTNFIVGSKDPNVSINLLELINDNKDEIIDLIDSIDEVLGTLNNKIDATGTALSDFKTNFEESFDTKSDDKIIYIVDDESNVIAKIDDTGIHSIDFFVDNQLSEKIVSLAELKDAFDKLRNNKDISIDTRLNTLRDELNVTINAHTTAISDHEDRLSTLIGDDIGKSMREIAVSEVVKVINDADPTDIDTLEEIAQWIINDKTGAAAISNQVSTNKNKIENHEGRITTAETSISNIQDHITNNIDQSLSKLEGIDTTAEEGKIVITDDTEENNKIVEIDSSGVKSVDFTTKEVSLNDLYNQFTTEQTTQSDINQGFNDRLDIIQGDSTIEGSIANSVQALKDELVPNDAGDITDLGIVKTWLYELNDNKLSTSTFSAYQTSQAEIDNEQNVAIQNRVTNEELTAYDEDVTTRMKNLRTNLYNIIVVRHDIQQDQIDNHETRLTTLESDETVENSVRYLIKQLEEAVINGALTYTDFKAIEDKLNQQDNILNLDETSNAFYIIDKDENVIFKVDNQGVSTTGLFASNLTFNNNYNMQLNGVFVDSDKLKDIEVEFDIED